MPKKYLLTAMLLDDLPPYIGTDLIGKTIKNILEDEGIPVESIDVKEVDDAKV